jgi:hypothetical protein
MAVAVSSLPTISIGTNSTRATTLLLLQAKINIYFAFIESVGRFGVSNVPALEAQ